MVKSILLATVASRLFFRQPCTKPPTNALSEAYFLHFFLFFSFHLSSECEAQNEFTPCGVINCPRRNFGFPIFLNSYFPDSPERRRICHRGGWMLAIVANVGAYFSLAD